MLTVVGDKIRSYYLSKKKEKVATCTSCGHALHEANVHIKKKIY
jgi:ribosomal protein L34E